MRNIISILLLCLVTQLSWAQSGNGYDPENPGDPDLYYKVTLQTSPSSAGYSNWSGTKQLAEDTQIKLYAKPNSGYRFLRWMEGDKLISTIDTLTYTVKAEDVTLTAYFEYNPVSPDDPDSLGYSHKVILYANPSSGGSFNASTQYIVEGTTGKVYAYPSSGYRFVSWKQNGKIISTSNPLEVKMGTENLEYTAQFVYDPTDPANPGANSFNTSTGELIIDDFKSGQLSSAIYSAVGSSDNYSKVKSVTIIGTMQAADFGFLKDMTNCAVADISRTTGYNAVPDYAFEDASALKTLILPYSVDSIGAKAFSGCSNLSLLYCYATTPPVVTETSFEGVPSTMKVLVPALFLELYQSANYWKNFTLSALDGVTNTLTVSLPEDAKDGRYKNMTLELDNISSGQVTRMLITDRTRYSFVNLIHNTKYNVYVKNANSAILGELQDIEIVDQDVEKAFSSLKQPQTVNLSVVNAKGEDLSAKTNVTWYDESGTYLSTGTSISGYVDGTVLKYRVKLSDEAALYYVAPQDSSYTVKAEGNDITCTLSPLKLVTLTGYVKNVNTKLEIYEASVSISQKTSGRQNRTVVAKTDVDGKFTAQVYNSPANISCSAYNYVNMSLELQSINVTNDTIKLDDILMNSVAGATVNVSFTYQESLPENQAPNILDYYSDYNNVDISIYNITADKDITQISNRYPQLVLMEGVKVGDQLRFTASSRKKVFEPVTVEKIVDESETVDATFAIKQYGGISTTYKTNSNTNAVAILYDKNGYLQQKTEFATDSISFAGLKDGEYNVVTMGKNDSYNSIYNMSRLRDAGPIAGVDYTQNTVTVESGVIKNVSVDNIPYLNLAKFQTIDMEKSSLSVNKSSVVAGNYLTFTGCVEMQDKSITITDGMKLVVDIPSSASFVKGSVMVGDKVVDDYTFEGNTLTVPFNNIGSENKIKFCVVPTLEGSYQPSAMVGFKANGEDIMIPLKGDSYTVTNADIKIPSFTAGKEITISGSSVAGASITIYDGDVEIGNLITPQSGSWSGKFELNNVYNLSSHFIKAKIVKDDAVIVTETHSVLYNKSILIPEKVTMDYYGSKTVFDLVNLTSTGYYYYTFNPTFTFAIDFTNNDTTKIKNVSLNVFTSDKSHVTLNTVFDKEKKQWIASHNFSSSSKLPVNVSVEYQADNTVEFDEDNANRIVSDLRTEQNKSDNEDSLYNALFNKFEKALSNNTVTDDSLLVLVDSIAKLDNHIFTDDEIVVCNNLIKEITFSDPGQLDEVFNKYEPTESEDYKKAKSCLPVKYGTIPKQSTGVYTTPTYTYDKKSTPTGDLSKDTPTGQWNVNEDTSNPNNIRFISQTTGDIVSMNYGNQVPDISNGTTAELQDGFSRLNAMCDSYLATFSTDGLSFELIEQLCKERIEQLRPTESMYTRCMHNIISNKSSGSTVDRTVLKEVLARKQTARLAISEAGRVKNLAKIGGHVASGVGLVQLGFHIHESITESQKWDNLIKNIAKYCKESDKSSFTKEAEDYRLWLNRRNTLNCAGQAGCIGIGVAGGVLALETGGLSLALNIVTFGIGAGLDFWKSNYNNTNKQNYNGLVTRIKNSDKCKGFEDNPDDPDTPDSKHGVDPSGYVYEGIFDNRLEGVTTTCYQKTQTENMYGDLVDNVTKWDATEYGQENPLHTDKDGFYQWFVPEGLWQVKYEKEGYETAYSEWLPVPPPQLDVNIGLVQNRQPEVKEAHAYEDGVELTFDKYMMPAYLIAENIKVSQNGSYLDGKVELLDETVAYKDENVKYASRARFIPNTAFTAGKEVTLIVANKVKSYAGVNMADTYTQSFDIEKEVKSIVADSETKVPYGGSKNINIYVQPADAAAGKVMHAVSSSEMLATLVEKDVTIDENGLAQFTVNGELPGTTGITFSIDGVNKTATVIANVGDFTTAVVNEPTASLASGSSVYRGTQITLSADNADYKIWYTTDGSCPCDENGTRKQYKEPLTISDAVTLKAIAENAEGEASDVATFIYNILQSKSGVALGNGWNWISFNMKNDALTSTTTALASGAWTSDDVIKDNQYVDMYSTSQSKWYGTLSKHSALNNSGMYKVRSSKVQTLGLTGEAVHPGETAITVGANWNYISYLPLVDMTVKEALVNYSAQQGDVIKSQDAFATYSSTNGWEGDLATLSVGKGYMLKRSSTAASLTFNYPIVAPSASSAKAMYVASILSTGSVSEHRFADNMNLIGEISGIKVEDGDSLIAFAGGDVRGASRLTANSKVYLTVNGEDDCPLALCLQRDGEIIATASNVIGYQTNKVVGSADTPTEIKFVSQNDAENISGKIEAIYSVNGQKLSTRQLSSVPTGIYIVYSKLNGNANVNKFVKK